MTESFRQQVESIDKEGAFELFVREIQLNKGKYVPTFQNMGDELGLDPSLIDYLFHTEKWALKLIERETELALTEEILAKKDWLETRKSLYEMGKATINKLVEQFNDGDLPFDVKLLKSDPKHLERFLKIMESLASVKMTGNESVIKNVVVNQQVNNETTNVSGVDNDKINNILNKDGFVENGEFKVIKREKDNE